MLSRMTRLYCHTLGLAIAGISIFFAPACTQEDGGCLQLLVSPIESEFELGDVVALEVSFKNACDSQLVFCFPVHVQQRTCWEITCLLSRPDGEQVLLMFDPRVSMIYCIERKDFYTLASGEEKRLLIVFGEDLPAWAFEHGYGGFWAPPSLRTWTLLRKYNPEASFASQTEIDEKDSVLFTEKAVRGVFDLAGEYEIAVKYSNRAKGLTCGFVPCGEEFEVHEEFPTTWTGTLVRRASFRVVDRMSK